MIVKRPRILGGFLAQNPEFDSFSIDLIKEMFKSDVVEREKLSKAEGRMEVAVQKNRISEIQDRGLRV